MMPPFFLQIQGSGTIVLPNKEEQVVGYAAQNGHQYIAIGRFLRDHIPIEEMSMQRIEQHLRTLSNDEIMDFLNQNPSYVFFQKLNSRPLTSMGMEVIDHRSIATDTQFFTKGLVGFLEVPHPSEDKIIRRLVFNQDSGGAIKGPGRVDLFWGRGKDAGMQAGAMRDRGRLWFILPKKL